MQLIDTHCHLTFPPLSEDIDQVIQRSIAAGVTGWITVATDLEHCVRGLELSGRVSNLFVALGVHPHEAGKADGEDLDRISHMAASSDRVVALGETGLDLHYLHSSLADQQRVFAWHLEQASRLQMPVVIHSREAFEQTLETLDRYKGMLERVVFHCFTGTPEQARAVIDRGFYVSFSGLVTFRNAVPVQQAARQVPLDRVLIETDCPYLSPEPMRKQRVNEPSLMIHTAAFMASLRRLDPESFAASLVDNARRFYRLPRVS
jgi:TatD DNase family protein